jgi:threonine dehydratase
MPSANTPAPNSTAAQASAAASRPSQAPPFLSADDYLKKILNARVYDVAHETALEEAKALSKLTGARVLLKREDQQPVFSFKLRGAYNKMVQLSAEQLKNGVICASAGNHAQGVALGAARLGTRALIVMPTTTPQVKVDAVQALGGEVVLHGDSYSDAHAHALQLQATQALSFIHPFDDPDVIAGQGTIAMEMLRQHQGRLDAVFVAIGGGGLISGVSAYIKAVRPEVKVIGVQMRDSQAMTLSVAEGERVTLADVGLFSDGTAVKLVGAETYRLASLYVDDYVVVDTDAVCAAIKDVFQDTRSLVEPAGALAVAGLKAYAAQQRRAQTAHQPSATPSPLRHDVPTYAAILCGANMNFDRLRFIAERAVVGEEKEALFAVTMPEERGSFRRFCETIGALPGTGRSVTEFNYRMNDDQVAHVFVGLSTQGAGESAQLAEAFTSAGFATIDLTHDDLAQEHLRHLVGGRTALAANERLLRFVFPERPGALIKFLAAMKPEWNISLFHYRNQGADYGKILVGMQVPDGDNAGFDAFLNHLGYPFVDETNNPAYRLFLRA